MLADVQGAKDARSWCSSLGSFDKISEYYSENEVPAFLNFASAWPKFLKAKKMTAGALIGLTFGITKANAVIPTVTSVGNSSLLRRASYLKMPPAKPKEAVGNCAAIKGSLPVIYDFDDEAALLELGTTYGTNTMYLHGKFEKSGLYDYKGGHKYGVYSSAANRAFDLNDKENGALSVVISDDVVSIGSSKADASAVALPFLCMTSNPQMRRNLPFNSDTKSLLTMIQKILIMYESDLSQIELHIVGNSEESITLETAPSNVSAISISDIPLGFEGIESILLILASKTFYTEGKIDQLNLLYTYRIALKEARKISRLSRKAIKLPVTPELKHYITKRSAHPVNDTYVDLINKRGIWSAASPLIAHAAAAVLKPYASKVVQSIISFVDKNIPNIVYKLRPYFLNTNELLSDGYLVTRGDDVAYTTPQRPRRSGCRMVENGQGPETVCRSGPLVDRAQRRFKCGEGILQGRIDDECGRRDSPHEVLLYPNVNCQATGPDSGEGIPDGRSDAVISKKADKIEYICGGRQSKVLKLQKGLNLFPIDYRGDCSFIYQNNLLFNRPRTKNFPFPDISSVHEGFSPVEVKEKTHSTFLGDFTTRELRNLILGLILSIILTAISSIVCGCARIRNKVLDFFFPCRSKQAMMKWRKRCDCCCDDQNQGCVMSGSVDTDIPLEENPGRGPRIEAEVSVGQGRAKPPSAPMLSGPSSSPPSYYPTPPRRSSQSQSQWRGTTPESEPLNPDRIAVAISTTQ